MRSDIGGKSAGSTIRSGVNPAPHLTSFATLSKLFSFSNPQFPPPKNEDENNTSADGPGDLNEVSHLCERDGRFSTPSGRLLETSEVNCCCCH